MLTPLPLFLALLWTPLSFAGSGSFDYRPGSVWGGTCDSGMRQSPANIADAGITFTYCTTIIRLLSIDVVPAPKSDGKINIVTFGTLNQYLVFFTGTCLEVELSPEHFTTPSEVYIPANSYTIGASVKAKKGQMLKVQPIQFHFHTHSEHTIDGAYGASELHIVTVVQDGQSDHCDKNGPCLAVFGVLLDFTPGIQGGNPIFDDLIKDPPEAQGRDEGHVVEKTLNLDDLLPKNRDYYTYLGSLTTPPCTESVTWIVFKEQVGVSTNFIESHQKLVCFTKGEGCTFSLFSNCYPPREKTNNRMVQKLHGRTIYSVKYEKPSFMPFAT